MGFEAYAIVEIFGHTRIAGKVTEQAIGGCSFIRVDVPETKHQKAFTKMFGQGAIYSMTPVDEETCKIAAESYRVEPIEVWRLELPERVSTTALLDDPDDYDQDDDQDDDNDLRF